MRTITYETISKYNMKYLKTLNGVPFESIVKDERRS